MSPDGNEVSDDCENACLNDEQDYQSSDHEQEFEKIAQETVIVRDEGQKVE